VGCLSAVWALLSKADLPAWLQAFAAVVALFISVWAALRSGRLERRRDALEARGIAVAIYPELLQLEVIMKNTKDYLDRLVDQLAGKVVGQSIAMNIENAQIGLPPMIERNVDRLFMLGEPAGPACLQLVNVINQYNAFVHEIAARTTMMNATQWSEGVGQLKQHLTLLEAVVATCKHHVAPMHDAIKN
jgi:hypothetical protein